MMAWVVFALVGCKNDDAAPAEGTAAPAGASVPAVDCEAAVAKNLECIPDSRKDSKEAQIADCVARTTLEGAEAERARRTLGSCLGEKSCAEFTRCRMGVAEGELRAKQAGRAKDQLASLRKFAAEKSWTQATQICAAFDAATSDSPELKSICDTVAAGATKALLAELVAVRDALLPEDTVLRCVDLEQLAHKVSAETETEAKRLCRELSVVRRVTEAQSAVKVALQAGAGEVPFQCGWALQDLDGIDSPWAKKTLESVQALCNVDLPTRLVDASRKVLEKMRDDGDTSDGFSKCFDFKRLARGLGEAAEGRARALCDEVDVAGDVGKALTEAKTGDEKQAEELPFLCDYTISRLERLTGSEWAKTKAIELARACYVVAGKHVLQKKLPGMKVGCDFQVQKVYDGARKFALSDPSVDALLLQAEPKCKK